MSSFELVYDESPYSNIYKQLNYNIICFHFCTCIIVQYIIYWYQNYSQNKKKIILTVIFNYLLGNFFWDYKFIKEQILKYNFCTLLPWLYGSQYNASHNFLLAAIYPFHVMKIMLMHDSHTCHHNKLFLWLVIYAVQYM